MIRINTNHILSAIVIILAILCCASIYAPVHFNNERIARENAIKARLIAIRHAEEAYKRMYGTYTNSFKVLADNRLIADSTQYVPYSGGKRFDLTTSIHTGKSGTPVTLVECGATFETYLNGLNEKRINELTEQANERGDYPGLKFGDITTPNDNAGNWE